MQLTKQVDVPARVAARQLAEATGAEVIQVIGKTTTLYRHNPDLKWRSGDWFAPSDDTNKGGD